MSTIEIRECPCCGRHDEREEVFDGDQLPCGCPCWWSVDDESAWISGPKVCCSRCAAEELAAKDTRIAELEAELGYVSGYQADLACIDRILDEYNAPHDPEDGVSLSPKRIRLMGERIAELEAKLSALTTRQPMETAPRDGSPFLAETTWGEKRVLIYERVFQRFSPPTEPGTPFYLSNLVGWYVLPEEVSRG